MLKIVVFNDLDSDGVQDDGEAGLAGWHISQGCSDALYPLTTDDTGAAVASWSHDGCFSLDRQFEWLPTRNGVHVSVTPESMAGEPLLFGVHDYGRSVMELRGEAIGNGLPLIQGEPGIGEPFRSCGHLFVEFAAPSLTQVGVIVESAATRAGCPSPGDEIAPSLGSPSPAGAALAFNAGATADVTWVENGDSMRFYSVGVTGAWVFDPATSTLAQNCGVSVPVQGGLTPPGFERIFVLSDEARPGCGAPGRQVRLVRGGALLDPSLEWHAGTVATPPQFVVAPVREVVGPATGDGAMAARSNSAAVVSLALALAALGCAAIGSGMVIRRR